ncbi:MAG: glycosyltransferase family 4 protein [Chloroflexi bacterium]|nr:glycosyltransferase family 4 protein [Chloroflexota bacterium]
MRAAIDARLIHYQKAGIGVYVSRLLQEFEDVADSSEFAVLLSRKDESSAATQNHFRKVRLWTPCHHRFEQIGLPIELLRQGIDLLHSPDFIPPFVRRCKSVITIHDLAFLLYPQILTLGSRRYYSQVFRAARSADAIIAVSNSTKRDIVERLGVPETKVFVVHHGVDRMFRPLKELRRVEEPLRRLGVTVPFVLFVGTLEPRKNLVTFLDAFAQVLSARAQSAEEHGASVMKLVVAGSKGWLCDDVFSRVRSLGLSDRVIFTGQVEAEDLVALYNGATLLVQPSVYEGFGFPPLEAMACGTPCVVSNTSSLPEVVGEAAVKVSPLDVQGWTLAMLRLLSSREERDDLVSRGLERSRQFTWSAAAMKTLEVYHLVCEGGREA